MSIPQTIQNRFVNAPAQASASKTQQAQDQTLPQTFTASTACVREKKNVASNVTTSSLCELELCKRKNSGTLELFELCELCERLDEALNCEEAERAFATLKIKMERDARQKKENSKITLWLFNNTIFACSIKVKKHFYTVQTVVLLTIGMIALLLFLILCAFIFARKINIVY